MHSFRNELITFVLFISLSSISPPPRFLSLTCTFSRCTLIHSYIRPLSLHSFPPSHALPPLTLPFFLSPFSPTPIRFPFLFPFSYRSLIVFFFSLFWKRYRYPPLCLNCRSRDSRPRRARLRGLPPAMLLPTQQQQGRFTSLISRHLSSLRD